MADLRGTGYEVLVLRLERAEEEIKELKKELKSTSKDNDAKFDEINDRIDTINEFAVEVRMMMQNFALAQSDMKGDIKGIAASAGKDQGWRALLTDIVKAVLMILGFILGGKWLG